MPFCPNCGKDLKEQVSFCPNCSFPVSDLFKVSQQPVGTPAAAVHAVIIGRRTPPIAAASIICLLIGVSDLILGSALFGLAAGIGGQIIAYSTSDLMKVIIAVGLSFGVVAGIVLLVLAIIHIFGWYWLWGTKLKGGVVGIIAGIVDVSAILFGMIWLSILILPTLGLSLLAVPFLLPILVVVSLLGIIMLIMIAIGWKTLE